tara:strand:- start:1010 stop:1243 length:234 start_codon:yes stop_codon:yes gene_type:complete
MGRRLYKSWLGIPVLLITGLALFILFSTLYDFFVMDRSGMRYALLGASILIILITIGLGFTPLSAISHQARRQMGTN